MKKNIKVLSLFSGIGAFEKALSNLDINYELIGYCENDKYASKAYSAVHIKELFLLLYILTKNICYNSLILRERG